jgi:hypothetical protein
MAKFVPLLRQLAPTLPLLSGCYGATEGAFGVAAELVEFAELAVSGNLQLNGSAGSGVELQHRTGSRDSSKQEEAAAEDVTSSSDGWEVPESPPSVLSGLDAREGEGELSFREFSREAPDQVSYILCPDANCYLEFLPLEQGGDASPGTQEPLRQAPAATSLLHACAWCGQPGCLLSPAFNGCPPARPPAWQPGHMQPAGLLWLGLLEAPSTAALPRHKLFLACLPILHRLQVELHFLLQDA